MGQFPAIFAVLIISFSATAQTGTADTIYIDVPAEVAALRLQTSLYLSIGKKEKEKFGNKFLCYTVMQTWCYDGEKLPRKKFKELFKKIQCYPYDKIIFNGFIIDKVEMDYPTEAGVIAGLLVGEKPVLYFRRKQEN